MECFATNEEFMLIKALTSETDSEVKLGSEIYQALLDDDRDYIMIESSSAPGMTDSEEHLHFDTTEFTSTEAVEDLSSFQPTSTTTYLSPPDSDMTVSLVSESPSPRELPPLLSPPLLTFDTEGLDRSGWPWPLPSQVTIPSPPPEPLPWAWRCHKCDRRWLLSVTRCCWHCKHYYCSEPSADPREGRKKQHRKCITEFDFIGWDEWKTWKRQAMALKAYSQALIDEEGRVTVRNPIIRGCEGCSYPSQCAYEGEGPDEEIEAHEYLDLGKTRRRRSRGEETSFDSDESFEL